MKSTVYLDTTIPSYLFDERESIRLHIEVTRKWWNEESHNYDVWASEATLDEISEGHYQKTGTFDIRGWHSAPDA